MRTQTAAVVSLLVSRDGLRQPSRAPSGRWTWTGVLASSAGGLALVVVLSAIWLALWALGPALLPGWSSQVVLSDSMGPVISRGDVVVAAPAAHVEPADVIVHRRPDGDLVTHRVISVTPDGEFVTRGDANRAPDAVPVSPEDVIGVGRLLVPMIGLPAVWRLEGAWHHLVVLGLTAGVLLPAAGRTGRRRRGPSVSDACPAPTEAAPSASLPGQVAPPRPAVAAPATSASPALSTPTVWCASRPPQADHRRRSPSRWRSGRRSAAGFGATLLVLVAVVVQDAGTAWPRTTGASFAGDTAMEASWTTYGWLGWWDENHGLRLPLHVATRSVAPEHGYEGYTVRAVLDTASLIQEGRLRPDCADLRVARAQLPGWQELHRDVRGCGTSTTEVWFALVEDPGTDATDERYWLYLDHAAATAAPQDRGRVYLAHDDLGGQTPGQPPTGWTIEGGGDWEVVSGSGGNHLRGEPARAQGRGQGQGQGGAQEAMLTLDHGGEGDVLVEARVRGELSAQSAICALTRATGGLSGPGYTGCVTAGGGSYDHEVRRHGASGVELLQHEPTDWDATAWHRLGLASVGSTHQLHRGGSTALEVEDDVVPGGGRAGLWVALHNRAIEIDELLVRRLVSDEPQVTVGAPEPRP